MAPHAEHDALLAKVRLKQADVGRIVADGLHGVRCRPDLAAALAEREALAAGEAFVTPAGHLVTAQSVTFFAPDNELHGVLARQRELDELDGAMAARAPRPPTRARSAMPSTRSCRSRSTRITPKAWPSVRSSGASTTSSSS